MIEKYIQLSRGGVIPTDDLISVGRKITPAHYGNTSQFIYWLILTYKIKNSFQIIEVCYGTSDSTERGLDLERIAKIILTK